MDFERSAMLLLVMEKSLPYPHLRWLHDAALKEVLGLRDKPKPKPEPEKVPIEPLPDSPSFKRPVGGEEFPNE